MLPSYVIEQIRRREEEQRRRREIQPALELPEPPRPPDEPETEERRVVIIEL